MGNQTTIEKAHDFVKQRNARHHNQTNCSSNSLQHHQAIGAESEGGISDKTSANLITSTEIRDNQGSDQSRNGHSGHTHENRYFDMNPTIQQQTETSNAHPIPTHDPFLLLIRNMIQAQVREATMHLIPQHQPLYPMPIHYYQNQPQTQIA